MTLPGGWSRVPPLSSGVHTLIHGKACKGVFAAAVLGFLLAGSAGAAGFSFDAQGAKAMGLAGAFVAQADDPSALFYNPGGLALLKKKKAGVAGAASYRLNESLFQGLPPGSAAGTASEQETPSELVPHLYVTLPLGSRAVVGMGVNSPFLLHSEWSDPATFAGRRQTTRAELSTLEVTPAIAFALTPKLGIGLGVSYRSSEFKLSRREPRLNPFNGLEVDVAAIDVDTDMEAGVGWNAGLLHQVSPRFSWGLAYRSPIEVEYNGVSRLTQISTGNAQLDALVATTLPFDQDLGVTTRIEFPSVATFGIAVGLTQAILLEADVQQTGWQSFDGVAIAYSGHSDLNFGVRQDFEDSLSYRLGVRLRSAKGTELRFGAALEESPLPDARVSGFLPDAERTVYAVGLGRDWLDVAFSWISFEQRVITTNADGINGNWRANAWMASLTLKLQGKK